MERIKYRISLDMFEVASQTTIKAKKRDTACAIHITLMENRKPYKIADGCSAFFSAKKPDGNFLFNGETCRIEDNTIIYDFTEQTTPIEGIVECEVILSKDGQRLTSPRFNLKVDSTVYNGEDIISTPEADALKELTDRAEEIVNQYDEGIIVGKGYVDNNFANALKGSASGKVVAIRDVSPVQHDVKVKATPVVVAETDLSKGGSVTFDPISNWVVTTSLMWENINFKLADKTNKSSEYSPNELGGVAKYVKAECKDGVCTFYYYDDEAMTSLWHSYTTEGWDEPLIGVGSTYDDIHIKVEATIQDSVEVKVYGKNLFDISKIEKGSTGTFSVANGEIIFDYSKVTGDYFPFTYRIDVKPNTDYVLSIGVQESIDFVYVYSDKVFGNLVARFARNSGVFNSGNNNKLLIGFYSRQASRNTESTTETVRNIQVAVGKSKTDFEPYIESKTYTVTANGTAIASIYPSMTFVPETDGVELSVEYNRDINKAFAELQQVIAQLQTLAVATVPMNEGV